MSRIFRGNHGSRFVRTGARRGTRSRDTSALMILELLTNHVIAATGTPSRQRALVSAMMLRDCSLRVQMTLRQRQACRAIMRERAMNTCRPNVGRVFPYRYPARFGV